MSEPRKAGRDAAAQEKLFEKTLEGIEGEEPRGQRIVETIELLPEILGRRRARGEAVHTAAERAERSDDRAPPFIEIHAHEVRTLERKIVVGRIEQGAIETLHGQSAGERRRYRRAARRADVQIETARVESLERVFEGGQCTHLVHAAGDAAARQTQRKLHATHARQS
jgi:hypothetical protein